MKHFIMTAGLLFFFSTAFCQTKIDIAAVSGHIGENVTICAKVYGTKALEKVTFLDLGAAYPNSPLTVVIFAKDRTNFKEAPEVTYEGKNICVTGIVKDYKGKPEIIVNSPRQIVVQ